MVKREENGNVWIKIPPVVLRWFLPLVLGGAVATGGFVIPGAHPTTEQAISAEAVWKRLDGIEKEMATLSGNVGTLKEDMRDVKRALWSGRSRNSADRDEP